MLNTQIIQAVERLAPTYLQESWDNTGLQVGTLGIECTGVLICLDVTPAVVDEAIALGYNLIVSHHPLFFKGVKRLTGQTPQQVCAMNAIAAGITIYSTHTAIDSAPGGVSYELARLLGVTPLKVLDPQSDTLCMLQVTAPTSHAQMVRLAMFQAGAGAIGNYDCCSYNLQGYGTFRALDDAHPYVGDIGEEHTEDETQVTVVLPRRLISRVESAMLEVHPYEVPAYQIVPMLNRLKHTGLGVYGVAEDQPTPGRLAQTIKDALHATTLRTTTPPPADTRIRRVAMCGGAGHEYIDTAIALGAQVYITADLKYHDFADYDGRIWLIDAGHHETEAPIKEVLYRQIQKECPGLQAIALSKHDDNPINYI